MTVTKLLTKIILAHVLIFDDNFFSCRKNNLNNIFERVFKDSQWHYNAITIFL